MLAAQRSSSRVAFQRSCVVSTPCHARPSTLRPHQLSQKQRTRSVSACALEPTLLRYLLSHGVCAPGLLNDLDTLGCRTCDDLQYLSKEAIESLEGLGGVPPVQLGRLRVAKQGDVGEWQRRAVNTNGDGSLAPNTTTPKIWNLETGTEVSASETASDPSGRLMRGRNAPAEAQGEDRLRRLLMEAVEALEKADGVTPAQLNRLRAAAQGAAGKWQRRALASGVASSAAVGPPEPEGSALYTIAAGAGSSGIAFSPDGKYMAAGLAVGVIKIWCLNTGKEAGVVDILTNDEKRRVLRKQTASADVQARSVYWTRDGDQLLVDRGYCRESYRVPINLDEDKNEDRDQYEDEKEDTDKEEADRDTDARGAVVLYNSQAWWLAASAPSFTAQPEFVPVPEPPPIYTDWRQDYEDRSSYHLQAGSARVVSVSVSADRKQLVTGSDEGMVCVYDMTTLLASNGYGYQPRRLMFEETSGQAPIRSSLCSPYALTSVALTPCGTTAVCVVEDGSVQSWEVKDGQATACKVLELASPHCPQTAATVAVSPDGSLVAIRAKNGSIRVRRLP